MIATHIPCLLSLLAVMMMVTFSEAFRHGNCDFGSCAVNTVLNQSRFRETVALGPNRIKFQVSHSPRHDPHHLDSDILKGVWYALRKRQRCLGSINLIRASGPGVDADVVELLVQA